MYGVNRAQEMKENMKFRKTRSSPSADEKIEIGNRFKSYWDANPGKAGFASKPQLDKLNCKQCGMLVDPGNYVQHHGDKCKRIKSTCPTCDTSFSTVPWENKKYCCRACVMQARRKDAFANSI